MGGASRRPHDRLIGVWTIANLWAYIAVGALLVLFGSTAFAQGPIDQTPVLISADEITYDETLAIVKASGNVEVSQAGRVLLADTISYNQRTTVVTASGNVTLMEPNGDVLFADFVELTDDMREGFIRDVRILLSDRSRLAAASGLRSGGRKTLFRKAVFSPCELCRQDPTRAPLWQLKAVEVEHDQTEKVIRYRDAWMEMFGVPVMYMPYFEHPDPTVERKSGLLAPTIGSSDILGLTYQQPYHWAIGPDRDATFAPIFTTKMGVAMAGDYRHLFESGRLDIRASGTVADRVNSDGVVEEDSFRGHIDSTLRYDLTDIWRAGADVQLASDDTYMRVYKFSNERTLTSRAFAEGFKGRDYLAINNYYFQGLRATDRQSESPIILPLVDYNFVSEPGVGGGRYTFDGNLLALTRRDGRDSRRISTVTGWELPFTSPLGDIYTFGARLQADAYWVQGVDPNSNDPNPQGRKVDEVTGRFFPQVSANWRYPWGRSTGSIHQIIQPMTQVVLAPNGSNPDEIPNEDSLDFEFDDTNLFSLNRFPGRDRVDSGSRVDYGLKWSASGEEGGYANAFLGQSYRFARQSDGPAGSGIEEKLSDVVGRVQFVPLQDLDLTYRTRLDKDDFSFRRNEIGVHAGPPILDLDLRYALVKSVPVQSEFGNREELTWRLGSRLSRYWSVFGGQRIDLEANETRQSRIGIDYRDECFVIQGVVERNFFSDREIEPETAFFITVSFKYLGEFSSGGIGNSR